MERRPKDLVTKRSEFIGFPTALYVEKSKDHEVADSEDEKEAKKRVVRRVAGPKIEEADEEK